MNKKIFLVSMAIVVVLLLTIVAITALTPKKSMEQKDESNTESKVIANPKDIEPDTSEPQTDDTSDAEVSIPDTSEPQTDDTSKAEPVNNDNNKGDTSTPQQPKDPDTSTPEKPKDPEPPIIIAPEWIAVNADMWIKTNAYFRTEPSTNSTSKVIAVLAKGAKIRALEKNSDGWYKIKYNDTIGYVRGSTLSSTKIEEPTPMQPQEPDKDNPYYDGTPKPDLDKYKPDIIEIPPSEDDRWGDGIKF